MFSVCSGEYSAVVPSVIAGLQQALENWAGVGGEGWVRRHASL